MPAPTCGVSESSSTRWQPGGCRPRWHTRIRRERCGRRARPRSTNLRTFRRSSRGSSVALCRVSARIATRRPEKWPANCVCCVAQLEDPSADGAGVRSHGGRRRAGGRAHAVAARRRSTHSRRRHGISRRSGGTQPRNARHYLDRYHAARKRRGNSRRRVPGGRHRRLAAQPAGAVLLHPSGGRERGGPLRAARRVAGAGRP